MIRIGIFCGLVIFLVYLVECHGVWWTAGGPLILHPRRICRKVEVVGGDALKNICRRDRQLLKEIVRGVELGMGECQYQLRNHRWNCTTKRRSLGKMLMKDTKEAAFVHAITAGAVAHAVSNACGKGRLKSCSCHQIRHYRATDGKWFWGGCGDNFDYGSQISMEFMDYGGEPAKDVRANILRHNNEVGRLAIKNRIGVKCKCHGLSASCDMKTCWPKMPPFRQTGDLLFRKFKDAKPVTPDNSIAGSFLWQEESGKEQRRRKMTKRTGEGEGVQDELVYLESSPNLCKRNRKMGVLGTRGRACNGTTTSESEGGCEYLCCGRGFDEQNVTVEARCCRFQWCCEVICETCVYNKTAYYCY